VTSSECRGADGVSGSERASEAQQEENAMAVFVVCFERKEVRITVSLMPISNTVRLISPLTET